MQFFRRQATLPFETVFGFFCIYSGVAGVLSFGVANDIFKLVLGGWSVIFNITYLVAGAGVFFGIGFNRRNVEAAGLILVSSSLVVRALVLYHNAGFESYIINSHIYGAAFVLACALRLRGLLLRRVIIEAETMSTGMLPDHASE